MASVPFALPPGVALPLPPSPQFTNLRQTAPDSTFSDDRIYWLGPRTLGVWMTPEQAIRLSAVWACITVISKAIASCRWDVFLEDEDGDREYQNNTRVWQLLNVRPNPETTPFAFKETALMLALTGGDFYAEIERDVLNRPLRLWQLASYRSSLERNRTSGNLVVRVSGNSGASDVTLPYDDVFHLHGPGLDGISGLDVVALAARNLAEMLAVENATGQFYDNGMQLSGVLTSPRPLTKDRLADIRAEIEKRHRGKPGGFLILSGGMTWEALSANPKDAQLTEVKKNAVLDACRWFGVPPHMVAELTGATFTNIEQQGIEFVRNGLTPWCERLAQEADWKLLPSIGPYKTRIDTDWLAEGDAASKASADSTNVNNGLMTRNEVRRRRGLNSIGPDGDKITVNGNLITLEDAIKRESKPVNPVAPQPGQQTDASGNPLPATEDGNPLPEGESNGAKQASNGAVRAANGALNGSSHPN